MANVIKIHNLFPTAVHEFKYVAEQNLVDAIREEVLRSDTDTNFSKQSVDNSLIDKKGFENLTSKIVQTTKEVCSSYSYKYKNIEITNLWINFSPKGTVHNPHNHSNNLLSGVWYPFENTSNTPIIFIDPRPAANILLPEVHKYNVYNSSLSSFQPLKGRGYIFPSWLYHYVPPSKNDRISISWNILLRGNYGNPNDLQNASI